MSNRIDSLEIAIQVLDDNYHWMGGKAHLVQIDDILDILFLDLKDCRAAYKISPRFNLDNYKLTFYSLFIREYIAVPRIQSKVALKGFIYEGGFKDMKDQIFSKKSARTERGKRQ